MMTEEQMEQMTLKDIEQVAARFAKAVKDIKEAQSLFGGPQPQPVVQASDHVVASRVPPGVVIPQPGQGYVNGRTPVQWSAEELRLRAAARATAQAEANDVLPPKIKEAMGMQIGPLHPSPPVEEEA